MKHSHSNGGVTMHVMRSISMGMICSRVEVHMIMGGQITMCVTMDMHLEIKGPTQAPGADSDQHHSDDPFTAGRNHVNRYRLAKQPSNERDQSHASRVTRSPAHSGQPRALRVPDREWRYCRQMVRTQKDVSCPGDQSGKRSC